jgi:3-methyladenine DNA glycosylase/8-oxoguanine DNA glycosylase
MRPCLRPNLRYPFLTMTDQSAKQLWAFDHVAAIAHLTKDDARLAQLVAKARDFHLNIDELESPYEALLEAIAYQSISGKAARTIFARIKALGSDGRPPTPQQILAATSETLREAGLSFAKIASARDLAQKTIDGVVPTLEEAHKMSDQELVERLDSVRGIGAWTVEMFLIFRLGRPDVLPIHDYGVQKGFALLYGKRKIPKPKELAKFGERWRPYRTVASWYMWRAVEVAGKNARKVKKLPRNKKRVAIKRRVSIRRTARKKRSRK